MEGWEDLALGVVRKDRQSCCTFVEVVGAHGVADERGEVGEVPAAGQQLLCQALVQLGAPHHHIPQHHLLKAGLEGRVHGRVSDHNRASLDPCGNGS